MTYVHISICHDCNFFKSHSHLWDQIRNLLIQVTHWTPFINHLAIFKTALVQISINCLNTYHSNIDFFKIFRGSLKRNYNNLRLQQVLLVCVKWLINKNALGGFFLLLFSGHIKNPNIIQHCMYALQFYTRLIYNSINVSHTRGCVKHSLSGFIRAAAHSTIRLHLPVVILSKTLQDYWGRSFANKLQWALALTDIAFIVHYPPRTLPSGLFFKWKGE